MDEKIKNVAIALAVLVAASTYAVINLTDNRRSNDYYKRLDSARLQCGQEELAWQDDHYKNCMRNKGFSDNSN